MMCRISLRTLVCNILVLVFASGSSSDSFCGTEASLRSVSRRASPLHRLCGFVSPQRALSPGRSRSLERQPGWRSGQTRAGLDLIELSERRQRASTGGATSLGLTFYDVFGDREPWIIGAELAFGAAQLATLWYFIFKDPVRDEQERKWFFDLRLGNDDFDIKAARRGRRVIFLMTALTIIATGIQVVLDRDQTREYLRQWNEAGLYRQLSDSTNDLDEIIFNPEARAQFSVAKKSFLYEYFQKWQAGEVELPFDLPFLPKPTPPGS